MQAGGGYGSVTMMWAQNAQPLVVARYAASQIGTIALMTRVGWRLAQLAPPAMDLILHARWRRAQRSTPSNF